jgi:hypothetical protein
MKAILVGLILALAVPGAAWGQALTKTELFRLYAQAVHRGTIAARMEAMYDQLPAGAVKDAARASLKADLLEVLSTQLSSAQGNADSTSDLKDLVDDFN